MAVKISGLPEDVAPTDDDYIPTVDGAGPSNKRVPLAKLRELFNASPLTIQAPAALGATAPINQNAVVGERALWNIQSPAGEPADASAPYYLHITNGVDAENVIVVGRDGPARYLAGPLQHGYAAGPSTVAFAGYATSPASAGLMPAADKHVLDATVDELDVHLADAANPHGTTLQQAYAAGRSIDASAGAIEIDTPAPDGSDRAITTYANGLRAAALTPLGLTSAQPLTVAPDDQPAGNDGWPTVVRGGNGGAGASFGGTVQVQAGQVAGGADGDVLIGTERSTAIQLGKTGDGSSVQITGDLTVQSGAGGAQTVHITAASPAPDAIALEANGGVGGITLRINGDDYLRVSSGLVELLGDTTILGGLAVDGAITGLSAIASEAGTARDTASADSGKVVRCTAATTVTITALSLVAGVTIEYVQEGAGQVQIVAGGGVTLRYPSTFQAKTAAQYSSIVLTYVSATIVLVRGDLAPV